VLLILTALAGVVVLALAATLYSVLAWRALARRGPLVLFPLGLLSTAVCSLLLTLRSYHGALDGRIPLRPGVLSASALMFILLYGAGFAGSSIALWRRWRRPDRPLKAPITTGVGGFFLGVGLPLLYAFGRDIWTVLHA
jgi:hypothetical protein